MNIALTGGTGFIGSHFLKQALDAGHNITAIRRSPLSAPRISLIQSPCWLERQLSEVTSFDLTGCEVLVHLAAHTGNVPYDTLGNCLHWNLITVLNLFEQARLSGIKRYIVAGSCFEYGRSGERFEEIPITAPLEPTNSYAASKAAASIALCQWAKEHNINLEILRVFHVYGEGELETRFWPLLRKAAFSGENFKMTLGEQIRDFQPVERVAKAFLSRIVSADYNSHGVSVYNLSSNNFLSIREFAVQEWSSCNASGSILFGELPYRDNEVMKFVPGPDFLSI